MSIRKVAGLLDGWPAENFFRILAVVMRSLTLAELVTAEFGETLGSTLLNTSEVWITLSHFYAVNGKKGVLKLKKHVNEEFDAYILRLPPYVQKVMREEENRKAWEIEDGSACIETFLAAPKGMVDPPVAFECLSGKTKEDAVAVWSQFESEFGNGVEDALVEVKVRLASAWSEASVALKGCPQKAMEAAREAFEVARFYVLLGDFLKDSAGGSKGMAPRDMSTASSGSVIEQVAAKGWTEVDANSAKVSFADAELTQRVRDAGTKRTGIEESPRKGRSSVRINRWRVRGLPLLRL